MNFFYSIAIDLYSVAVKVAAVFNEKAKLFVAGRKKWQQNLKAKIDPASKYIWVHCASLGEFEQGRPLIEAIKEQFPEYKIVLTFFSPSGYEIRKNYALADVVAYLPLDTKRNARTFIGLVNPEKVFFVKYEYWHNYISELHSRRIPLYLISAIFRKEQPFFSKTSLGKWFLKMLFKVDHLFVQTKLSGELLESVGIKNYTVSGDTRFDRVASISAAAKDIPPVEKFKGSSLLVVAGSTWKPDEELLAAFINQSTGVKFIIAPHEVSAANVILIKQSITKPVIEYSKVQETEIANFDVIIIDSIGLLSSLYRYGNIAYIGGGFGVGIHNILEAATFGLPVVFGPNYQKFREAVELAAEGGAFPIASETEFFTNLNNLLTNKSLLEKSAATSRNYVAKNVGSTELIIKKVFNNPFSSN
jgi:3-deoxy-D-manno-octulosonic-acid transferase